MNVKIVLWLNKSVRGSNSLFRSARRTTWREGYLMC